MTVILEFLVTSIVLVLVIIGLVLFVKKTRSGAAVTNTVRGFDDQLANVLSDPERDGKLAIEDAQKELADLNSAIAELIAENNRLEGNVKAATSDVTKFENIAQKAGSQGKTDDVREALTLKKQAEEKLNTFQAQLGQNEALEAKLRDEANEYANRIEQAKNDSARYIASLKGAALRERLAKRSQAVGDGKGLAALDNLRDKAVNAEAQATAWEDIAASTPQNKSAALESKYSGLTTVSDDEIAKYVKAS